MPLSNRIKLILLFARVNMYVIELIHRNKHFPPKSRIFLLLQTTLIRGWGIYGV